MLKNKIKISVEICVDENTKAEDAIEDISKAIKNSEVILDSTALVFQSLELNNASDGDYYNDGHLYNKNGDIVKPKKLKWVDLHA